MLLVWLNLGITPHDIDVVKWRHTDAQTDDDGDYSCQ